MESSALSSLATDPLQLVSAEASAAVRRTRGERLRGVPSFAAASPGRRVCDQRVAIGKRTEALSRSQRVGAGAISWLGGARSQPARVGQTADRAPRRRRRRRGRIQQTQCGVSRSFSAQRCSRIRRSITLPAEVAKQCENRARYLGPARWLPCTTASSRLAPPLRRLENQ
jgi:hypothetical protein